VYFAQLYKPPPPFGASPIFNSQGFRILHYFPSKNAWPAAPADAALDVTDGKFASIAQDAWLVLESNKDGRQYIVEVYDIDHDQLYWTKSPDTHAIETYWFRYTLPRYCTHIGSITTCTWYAPLCQDKPDKGAMAMPAVVFEGEVYDPTMFTVNDTLMIPPNLAVGTWFNVACAGSIPAKMHMIRETRAAAKDVPVLPPPSKETRRGFMNAWAAKYCGPDKSYTQNGHSIRIRDLGNTLRSDFNVGFEDEDVLNHDAVIEAVWGANGALCLNQPRDESYTQAGVIAECGSHGYVLPTCPADVLDSWKAMAGVVALTANPK
jgi:hypothetical protein